MDRSCLEVEGNMASRTEGNTDDSLVAEISLLKTPKDEGTENTAIADIDIVMNHHLQEIHFTKEAYK